MPLALLDREFTRVPGFDRLKFDRSATGKSCVSPAIQYQGWAAGKAAPEQHVPSRLELCRHPVYLINLSLRDRHFGSVFPVA